MPKYTPEDKKAIYDADSSFLQDLEFVLEENDFEYMQKVINRFEKKLNIKSDQQAERIEE